MSRMTWKNKNKNLAESLLVSPALVCLGSRSELGRHENVVGSSCELCPGSSLQTPDLRKDLQVGLTFGGAEGFTCGPCAADVDGRRSHFTVGRRKQSWGLVDKGRGRHSLTVLCGALSNTVYFKLLANTLGCRYHYLDFKDEESEDLEGLLFAYNQAAGI